jgi:hypothetical protein
MTAGQIVYVTDIPDDALGVEGVLELAWLGIGSGQVNPGVGAVDDKTLRVLIQVVLQNELVGAGIEVDYIFDKKYPFFENYEQLKDFPPKWREFVVSIKDNLAEQALSDWSRIF